MVLYPVFVSQCTEQIKGKESIFDGVLFSFSRECIDVVIRTENTTTCGTVDYEYTDVLELICDDTTYNKIKCELKNGGCGWLYESDKDKGYKFYRKPDLKVWCPVMKGEGIAGYVKR